MGGTRVTIDYDANGWPTAVTHHPGLGDDVLLATEHGTSSTTGQTPEISGWGDGTAGAAQAGRAGSQALRTEFIRDVAGRLLQKRTANHHYHYRYDTVDQLLSATKLQVQPDGSLQPLHTTTFEYDLVGNLIAETATDAQTGQSHRLTHSHDPLGNRTQTVLPALAGPEGQAQMERALNYLHYGSGHLHQINLSQRDTQASPGTPDAQATQTTRFDYDAIGRRVAKHDHFGTTVFIWEGMRLIEERRGQSVISYVYEPGSYVPLARLDAQGQATEQGGLGTTQDAEPKNTPETIATSACHISAGGKKYHQSQQPAANDAEAQYWEALDTQTGTAQKTGTEAKLCDVYYFHTDQAGLPQELTNAQGQLVWQANYKTWGSTVSEEWEVKSLANQPVHTLDQGDIPKAEEEKQQNLRFQGQYLDRETGLHYNTFRYYDADIGRFICPDPIGLEGGINLGNYSPNPLSWIDPWGWQNRNSKNAKGHNVLYEVTDDGTPSGKKLKIGKAKGEDLKADGTNKRAAASARKAQKAGYPNAGARVVEDLGVTTTGKAERVEAKRVRTLRNQGHELPLNKEKRIMYKENSRPKGTKSC